MIPKPPRLAWFGLALRQQELGLRAIAEVLGRNVGSLTRELGRNIDSDGAYLSASAQLAAQAWRRAARPVAKLDPDGPLWPPVSHLLGWLWSPQQVAQTLRRMWPEQPEMHVSHETIFTALYAQPSRATGTEGQCGRRRPVSRGRSVTGSPPADKV